MNKQYDFIYLTNTPSFYKVRLCEELAKKHSVLLVLYGYGAEAVNTRLSGNEEVLTTSFCMREMREKETRLLSCSGS